MDRHSQEFKKLQSKWYKKLETEGFEDIEQLDGNLKLWSSHFFKSRHNATLFQAKEEYYRIAGHFLHEYQFETPTEKLIWEYHSTGVSLAQIVVNLKKKRIKTHTKKVHKVVKKLVKLMIHSCGGTE